MLDPAQLPFACKKNEKIKHFRHSHPSPDHPQQLEYYDNDDDYALHTGSVRAREKENWM